MDTGGEGWGVGGKQGSRVASKPPGPQNPGTKKKTRKGGRTNIGPFKVLNAVKPDTFYSWLNQTQKTPNPVRLEPGKKGKTKCQKKAVGEHS